MYVSLSMSQPFKKQNAELLPFSQRILGMLHWLLAVYGPLCQTQIQLLGFEPNYWQTVRALPCSGLEQVTTGRMMRHRVHLSLLNALLFVYQNKVPGKSSSCQRINHGHRKDVPCASSPKARPVLHRVLIHVLSFLQMQDMHHAR